MVPPSNYPSVGKISFIYAFFLILSIMSVHLTGLNIPERNGVLLIDEQNLESATSKYNYLLLFFESAPSTKESKTFLSVYEEASKQLNETDFFKKGHFGRVDSKKDPKVAETYHIKDFPTVILITKSQIFTYNGQRSTEALKQWVVKKTGEVSLLVESVEAFQKLKVQHENLLIYVGTSEKEDAFNAFKIVAGGNDDIVFVHTFNAELRKYLKVQKLYDLIIYTPFSTHGVHFTGKEAHIAGIREFIKLEYYPAVIPFNNQGAKAIFGGFDEPKSIFLLSTGNEKGQAWEKIFQQIGEQRKGKSPLFSLSIENDGFGNYERLQEYLGFQVKDGALIVAIQGDKKYLFKHTDLTVQNLNEFLRHYDENSLTPEIKSEDIPAESDNSGPVRIIVGKSFIEEVERSNKDVLLEFYAPWCGHCKSLAPIYEDLAKSLKHNSNLKIAKIDATLNEIPSLKIQGFPTILFFRRDNLQHPITYEGPRTFEALKQFLKENTSFDLVEPDEPEQKVELEKKVEPERKDDF